MPNNFWSTNHAARNNIIINREDIWETNLEHSANVQIFLFTVIKIFYTEEKWRHITVKIKETVIFIYIYTTCM